ncbi:Chromosomal serine/threonine-protein kinase jil-1, partial [Gamsiella multidivaricata]
QPNEVFRFPTSDIDQNFTPGKCVETSPTTVYFLSDYFQGGTMTVNSTTKNGTWSGTSSQTEPDMFQLKDLKAATFALSLNATAQSPIPIVVVATPNNQIYKWATSAKATSLVATLADLEIPSTQNILGMEMSWAGSTGFVWIHYTDKNQQAVLLRVNTASKEEKQPFLVDPSQILLPLSSGNGVALLGANSTSSGYILSKFPNTGAEKPLPVIIPVANAVLKPNTFVVNDTMVWQINSNGASANPISYTPSTPAGSTSTGVSTPTSSPVTSAPASGSNSRLPVIIGSVVGALALVVIVAFILIRRRNSRGNWSKKQKGLFPAKGDESMVPLGLYHQNRSLPEPPRYLENDLERLGHAPRPGNGFAQAKYSNNAPPYLYSRNPTESHLDESIPVEAALAHHRYDKHTPQGLTHSISVSSTTSKFPRRNVKSGKRFEEKIQLQVIRYEIPDAHLISPHGPTGRLVLGTYHVVSPARSARSIKAQGGASQGMARSGTVVVRRSRMDFGHGRSASSSAGRAMSPLQELSENSSMLLTDAENQHTFEVATLKWYMTEIHWKREAALLKHLKSPIFVMELLESYCIPALQNRAHTYPFVNAMGGCSSLLSDIKPIKTAQHARAILRSISAAVDWCHRHGVVHLNLQPGSFFLEDGIDPSAEDAPWKLWDFTCARFMGEPIGPVGGGGEDSAQQDFVSTPQPPLDHLNPETYPILEQRQLEERMDRIGGNPLPAAYTAPELLEAWRARDTT